MLEQAMVLLDVPNYAGESSQVVEKVQLVNGDRALVHWFKGSKTISWQPCKECSVTRENWGPWHKHNMVFQLSTNSK